MRCCNTPCRVFPLGVSVWIQATGRPWDTLAVPGTVTAELLLNPLFLCCLKVQRGRAATKFKGGWGGRLTFCRQSNSHSKHVNSVSVAQVTSVATGFWCLGLCKHSKWRAECKLAWPLTGFHTDWSNMLIFVQAKNVFYT